MLRALAASATTPEDREAYAKAVAALAPPTKADPIQACAAACAECATACDEVAAGGTDMAACIAACVKCSQSCAVCAHHAEGEGMSDLASKCTACAEACAKCIEACAAGGDAAVTAAKACAESCRSCEKACKAAMSSPPVSKKRKPAPKRKALSGTWVNSGAPAEGDEPVIVFARILSADEPDGQGDKMPDPEERAKTIAALKADVAAGLMLEMGKNHEGAPTPELKGLSVEECTEDVEIGGVKAFGAGDLVLKAALYGARKAAFLAGRTTGFSLEAVEDPSMAQAAA